MHYMCIAIIILPIIYLSSMVVTYIYTCNDKKIAIIHITANSRYFNMIGHFPKQIYMIALGILIAYHSGMHVK